jgi:hypothetical protein
LDKIQKNKETALMQLDIQYASADKAKTSFGYIGITFLAFLFGSIFANDFIKLFLFYFDKLSRWWSKEKKTNENKQSTIGDKKKQVVFEIKQINSFDLEESLEKFYIKLLKANAKNKKTKYEKPQRLNENNISRI